MGTAPQRAFGVAVPVRAFRLGNTRLASGLDDTTRTALARRLAERVVTATGDAPVVVVTSAPEVVEWAGDLGIGVVPDPGSLDAAARVGVAELTRLGCRRVVVAHADLAFVTDFTPVTRDAGVPTAVLVPCHHDDGTPVLSLPAGVDFAFAYGPGSFRRHVQVARAAGLAVRVVRDPALAFDVDTVDDVSVLAHHDPTLLGARIPSSTPPAPPEVTPR
ncbi:MAG: 2-phospho-L-lactate guanylyltransferase [Acidimicrobiia bacterium]|jgi:2-phospho-L-lactate guanylyltransferase